MRISKFKFLNNTGVIATTKSMQYICGYIKGLEKFNY